MLRPAIKFRCDLCKERKKKRRKVVNQRNVRIYIVRVVYNSTRHGLTARKSPVIGSILGRTRFGELSGESIYLYHRSRRRGAPSIHLSRCRECTG